MSTVTYKDSRYFATEENVKDVLEKYGVAIIPNVLTDEECKEMKSGMWDYLEHITSEFEIPMNRRNKTTWREYKNLYPKHSMLLQQWSIGHCQMLWDLRQKKSIYKPFCNIYDVKAKELLVSFDGASFHFPPELTNCGYRRKAESGWLHCDQSYMRNGAECVQAWVTANDVEEGDATLIFMQGSHKLHKAFKDEFGITIKADWLKLRDDQIQWYKDQGCKLYCIKCPKGSMCLWDSRTIHAAVESVRGRENPKIRCVGYMCFMPRSMATEAMLKKKRKAFDELRTTSHWPCKPKLFPTKPRTYGGPMPTVVPIEPPKVGKLGKIMAGF